MAIEIVDLPIKNGGSFHSYVNVYQRGMAFLSTYLKLKHPHGMVPDMWVSSQNPLYGSGINMD